MRQFEITVLGEQADATMALRDRCTLDAADTADAAKRYADLFEDRSEPRRAPPPSFSLAARIDAALKLARDYGSTDGDHHKAWVLDQMVRALTGGAEHMPDPGIAP